MALAAAFVSAQAAVAARHTSFLSQAEKSRASMSRWSVIQSPNPPGGDVTLEGVSCVSATNCIAVGDDVRNGSTVVEQSSGQTWSIVDAPRGVGSHGVSCVSASDCTAVSPPSQWNGIDWSITPSSTPSDGSLAAVSCVSAVACTAVGLVGNDAGGSNNGNATAGHTLVEHWNGATWLIIHAPNPSAGGELNAVACVSPTDCMAVGNSFGSGGGRTNNKATLVEHWNGEKWSITPSPDRGVLHAVSCVSVTDCIAVGATGGGTLIERWNGQKWSVTHSLTASSGGGELSGVSCVSATGCTAVGTSVDAPVSGTDVNVTLVEHWNGKRWSIEHSPNPVGGGALDAVSCVSATRCVAVGLSTGGGGRTLVEQENG